MYRTAKAACRGRMTDAAALLGINTSDDQGLDGCFGSQRPLKAGLRCDTDQMAIVSCHLTIGTLANSCEISLVELGLSRTNLCI